MEHRRPPTAGAVGSSGLGLGTPRRKGGARPAPARGPAGTHSHTQHAHGRTLAQAQRAISEFTHTRIKKHVKTGGRDSLPRHPGSTGTSNDSAPQVKSCGSRPPAAQSPHPCYCRARPPFGAGGLSVPRGPSARQQMPGIVVAGGSPGARDNNKIIYF